MKTALLAASLLMVVASPAAAENANAPESSSAESEDSTSATNKNAVTVAVSDGKPEAAPAVAAGLTTSAAMAAMAARITDLSRQLDSQQSTSGYKKGFYLRTTDDKFALKIQGRLQTRFQADNELDGDERDTDSKFSIARARLTLKGHVYDKGVQYKFQSDFGKGNVALKDFYLDYRLPKTSVRVRAGQYKRPFSRQQIASSGKLELVDRAIDDKFFRNGRDIGVTVHNNFEKSPKFEWAVGVFNGTGDKASFAGDVMIDPMTGEGEVTGGGFSNVPDEFEPAFVGRVGYNHNGIKGYSEADLEGGPLRFAVAAGAVAMTNIDDGSSSETRAGVDYSVKAHGFATTGGLTVASVQSGDAMMDQDLAALGAHVQAGYTVAENIQPTLRFATTLPEGPSNNVQEYSAGISIYAFSHNLKWQTDASVLAEQSENGTNNNYRLRSQLQLSF